MPANSTLTTEGISLKGEGGIKGKKREQKMARLVNKVFELREAGKRKVDIAKELHIQLGAVERILHDPDYVRRRLNSYNEHLRSMTPISLDVVREVLTTTAPQQLGERASMAKWVLEMGKTVGKESPVNVFIRGGDTHINVSNDTLEAARAVAAQMRAAVPQLGTGEVIDAEVIGTTARDGVQPTSAEEIGVDKE